MSSEKEMMAFYKAAVYDILQIIKEDPEKMYTVSELEALLAAYIRGMEST